MGMARLSRRDFLCMSGLAAAGVAAVACAPASAVIVKETVVVEKEVEKQVTKIVEKEVEKVVEVTKMPEEIVEAPGLSDLVADGKLPPLDERLPSEPRVVPVVEEIGQYGGTWRRVALGENDVSSWNTRLSYDCAARYGPDGLTVEPHIVQGWEVNEDSTQFTFYLRKGMKWSDGEPFTVDDVLFMWEDCENNAELMPSGPSSWLSVMGLPPVVERLDDYTLTWKFALPNGLFMQHMAAARYDWLAGFPKHYLGQFHPTYRDPEEVQKAAMDAGFQDWMGYFRDRRGWMNVERPLIKTWVPQRLPPDVPCVMERNPYYFLLDPAGKQLPYIDRLRFEVVANTDILNRKVTDGAVEMQFHRLSWETLPLLTQYAEQGDFRAVRWALAEGANACFVPNQNHEDPEIAKLMQQARFRQALSVAIDREELNKAVFGGLGTPRQASVVPSFPAWKESQSTAYAQYDPDLANQLLDEMGLAARDAEGYRLRSDGQPLTIACEYAPVYASWRYVVAVCAEYWGQVGIRVVPKEEPSSLFYERGLAGTVQEMSVWYQHSAAHFWVYPAFQVPVRGMPASSGALWYDWYTSGGKEGGEPPAEVKLAYELLDGIKTAGNQEERVSQAAKLLDLNAEQVWYIGTVGLLPYAGVVKNTFRNVPEGAVMSDWWCLTPGNTTIEQYYTREPLDWFDGGYGEELRFEAHTAGVTIRAPWQGEQIGRVDIHSLALRTDKDLKSEDDELWPGRTVIDFKVVQAETHELVKAFEARIELEVRYTAADVDNAGGLDQLAMGYWDEELGRWIRFKEEHDFKRDGDERGGSCYAVISSWGDRRIAFGGDR